MWIEIAIILLALFYIMELQAYRNQQKKNLKNIWIM